MPQCVARYPDHGAHGQQLETGTTVPEPDPEDHCLPCEDMGTDDDASVGEEIPGFNSMPLES